MNDRAWLGSKRFVRAGLGAFALALGLRAYHLTGFLLNYDEAHWLLYSLDKRLLFESLRSSRPRPEFLFPLMTSLPIRLFGPNELAMRFWPVLLGSLSVFPLGALIYRITRNRRAMLFGMVLLALLPLHVYLSAQGVPDTIALFFALCALVCFTRARETGERREFMRMGILLGVALLAKATALYGWVFMTAVGYFLIADERQRRTFYETLGLSIVPLVVVTLIILARHESVSFLHEPRVSEGFGFSFGRQWLELRYFVDFFGVLLLAAAVGASRTVYRAVMGSAEDRELLVWLLPLAELVPMGFFRPGHIELPWLVPTLCLFAVVAMTALRPSLAWVMAVVVGGILLVNSLMGVPFPYPGPALPASSYTTAVLMRPAGWPSRDARRWLVAHTSTEDAILMTAYTFTDPLLLELDDSRRVIPNASDNWEMLRDATNRVKYVVFTHDYRAYAPSLAQYADTHFTRPAEAQFSGYAVYDCQKDGNWVAYPDASNSGSQYVRAGMEFFQRHEMELAVESFQQALTVDPNQPVASANLCVLYFQMYREAEGIAQCERNIRFGIAPAISYGVLGQFRERQGDFAAALAAYEKSLTFDPQNPVTRQLLTDLQGRMRK